MPEERQTRLKDGVAWPIGSERTVEWIGSSRSGRQITVAIPPVFAGYATLVHPRTPGVRNVELERRQDLALVDLLRRHTEQQPWWLGYLDTGASDIVFWDAPKVTLYTGWRYVVVQAGPAEAASWRPNPDWGDNWKSTELPELIFPADHTWLVSTLWDDDWTCLGGSESLIADLLRDPVLAPNARRVTPDQDATPPGREAW